MTCGERLLGIMDTVLAECACAGCVNPWKTMVGPRVCLCARLHVECMLFKFCACVCDVENMCTCLCVWVARGRVCVCVCGVCV